MILTDKIFIENRPKSKEHIIGELRRAFEKEVVIIPSDPYEIRDFRLRAHPIKNVRRTIVTDNAHGINTRILSLGEDKNGDKVNLDNCEGALH